MYTFRPVSVVLCDRHIMCLESLAAALDDPLVLVVATTTSQADLPAVLALRRPAVCVIDLGTPDDACLDELAAITARAPQTGMIALVDDLPARVVGRAVDAGVNGFVRKDTTLRTLRHTIDRVAAGQTPVGADALLRIARLVTTQPEPSVGLARGQLTVREREVLDRMMAGEDTRHIAATLSISRSTARTHVQNVRHKLGVRTRLQAVALANGVAGSRYYDERAIAQ